MSASIDYLELEQIIEEHVAAGRSVIAVLNDVQEKYRYLPEEALVFVARRLGVPLSRVFSIATFFNAYSLEPKGKHHVQVCVGTACHVRGAARVTERVGLELGIEPGQTSDDGEFSFETVNCVGACALGPVMIVDRQYHGSLTPEKAVRALEKCRKCEGAAAAR